MVYRVIFSKLVTSNLLLKYLWKDSLWNSMKSEASMMLRSEHSCPISIGHTRMSRRHEECKGCSLISPKKNNHGHSFVLSIHADSDMDFEHCPSSYVSDSFDVNLFMPDLKRITNPLIQGYLTCIGLIDREWPCYVEFGEWPQLLSELLMSGCDYAEPLYCILPITTQNFMHKIWFENSKQAF